MQQRYILYFPTPTPPERLMGAKFGMLDYIMGQKPTDREYVVVYNSVIDVEPEQRVGIDPAPPAALSAIWQRHNVGDRGDDQRPRAQTIRSMCVGDLVYLCGMRGLWAVESVGFRQLSHEEVPKGIEFGELPEFRVTEDLDVLAMDDAELHGKLGFFTGLSKSGAGEFADILAELRREARHRANIRANPVPDMGEMVRVTALNNTHYNGTGFIRSKPPLYYGNYEVLFPYTGDRLMLRADEFCPV